MCRAKWFTRKRKTQNPQTKSPREKQQQQQLAAIQAIKRTPPLTPLFPNKRTSQITPPPNYQLFPWRRRRIVTHSTQNTKATIQNSNLSNSKQCKTPIFPTPNNAKLQSLSLSTP
jgi:hypothetical protein